jgi:hypothetical protein
MPWRRTHHGEGTVARITARERPHASRRGNGRSTEVQDPDPKLRIGERQPSRYVPAAARRLSLSLRAPHRYRPTPGAVADACRSVVHDAPASHFEKASRLTAMCAIQVELVNLESRPRRWASTPMKPMMSQRTRGTSRALFESQAIARESRFRALTAVAIALARRSILRVPYPVAVERP